MSDKRYEANIIRATAVEPANNLQTTSAPGVWSIDEVVELQKKEKWPTVGNVTTDVTDVFSTFLYEGNNTARTITNNIDLSGEGGLVWFKSRESSGGHTWYDTARGVEKAIYSNNTNAQGSTGSGVGLTAFNSNGFSLGTSWVGENTNNDDVVSWTFRKAPKFFDIVTYTGNSTSGRQIAHNLGSVPGMIIIKKTSGTGGWRTYHRGANGGTNPENYYADLNDTGAFSSLASVWNQTAPTATHFTLGDQIHVNQNGETFVAYLFAHNNNDGEFGPNQNEDVIKCASYTGAGSTDVDVNLGFEPQWIMIKKSSASGDNWLILDSMRGTVTGGLGTGQNDNRLFANLTNAEAGNEYLEFTSTGFKITGTSGDVASSGETYIYMAIRRGPLSQPTSATDVFESDLWTGNQTANRDVTGNTNVLTDLVLISDRDANSSGWSSYAHYIFDRPRGENLSLATSSTAQEVTGWNGYHAYNVSTAKGGWGLYGSNSNGAFLNKTGTDYVAHRWQRAPGYFDICTFTGNGGGNRDITHNLGSAPGMLWLKRRDNNSPYGDWYVQHTGIAASNYIRLNQNNSETTSPDAWNSTYASADVFRVGPDNNVNTYEYIVYLFGSLAGISKTGSYTGSSSGVVTVDCGFTSGARFVLIKRYDSGGTGDWYVYDSVRGINSGADDPYNLLNTSDAETTNTNNIEPHSSGFQLTQQGSNPVSINGASYIFYAIA